eukprot:scaffold43736_cov18-Tisochrysis_lutea.AAC.1
MPAGNNACTHALAVLKRMCLPSMPAGNEACTYALAVLKGRRLPAWKLRTSSVKEKERRGPSVN